MPTPEEIIQRYTAVQPKYLDAQQQLLDDEARERKRTIKDGGCSMYFVPDATSVETAFQQVQWPQAWPYTELDFFRANESPDESSYQSAFHGNQANAFSFASKLKQHYAEVFSAYPGARILDICSGQASYYPDEQSWSHVSITGPGEEELMQNDQADDYTVLDLNANPELPYPSGSFDVVTCAVSVNFMTRPLEVMTEVARVLKVGGVAILSTTSEIRLPEKTVRIWLRTGNLEHAIICGSYLHYTGKFEPAEGLDRSHFVSRGFGVGDSLYIVQARKRDPSLAREEVQSSLGAVPAALPVEAVRGLRAWLQVRQLERIHDAVEGWCLEMGAVDLGEVFESLEDIAEYLGERISEQERGRLLQGARCFRRSPPL